MLRGPSRRSNVSSARKVSMYVVREITGMSMEDIGSEFGGRDHSTVVYSINDMQKKLETDIPPAGDRGGHHQKRADLT